MTNQRKFFSLCLLKQSRPLDHIDVSKNGPMSLKGPSTFLLDDFDFILDVEGTRTSWRRSVPTDDLSFLFGGQTFAYVRPSQPYDPRPLRSLQLYFFKLRS